MVSIADLKAKYQAQRKNDRIFAIVLGPRGSGKSGTAAGTWPSGTKVLHIASTQEDHGIDSGMGVSKNKDDIIPVIFDIDDKGKKLNAKDAYEALKSLLTMDLTGIDVVVLDGLSSLDTIIANHPMVTGAKGYDGKKVGDQCFDEILSMLKAIGMSGKSVVITCPTEVRNNADTGLYHSPTLRGGSAVNVIVGACNEILSMGKVSTDKGLTYVFDFNGADMVKSGTKMSGDKYQLTVEPRIAGVQGQDIPPHMKASFAYLMKFKKDYEASKAKG